MLPCAVYFRTTGATILISRSFDGELITRILGLFGFCAVRGSSSRGAREGLLGLKDVIEAGGPAIFTADGPRGPIYQTKMGPIKLAQMTGARIGAFHLEPERAWVMGSWDKFLVPKPFTRIVVSWARWTTVPAGLSDLEPKRAAEEFEAKLRKLIDDAPLRHRVATKAYAYVKENRLLSQHYRKRRDWYFSMRDKLPELTAELRGRVPELFTG